MVVKGVALGQGSADFVCKGPERKYFRLRGPYAVSVASSLLKTF